MRFRFICTRWRSREIVKKIVCVCVCVCGTGPSWVIVSCWSAWNIIFVHGILSFIVIYPVPVRCLPHLLMTHISISTNQCSGLPKPSLIYSNVHLGCWVVLVLEMRCVSRLGSFFVGWGHCWEMCSLLSHIVR